MICRSDADVLDYVEVSVSGVESVVWCGCDVEVVAVRCDVVMSSCWIGYL